MTPPPTTLEAALAQLAQREQEVTELRAAQQEFLRAVSHDLRAPLRHITAYGGLVRELLDDAGLQGDAAIEARQFLGTMEQSAQRLARMVDGLLAIARAGQAALLAQPVPLAAAVARAQLAVQPAAAARSADAPVQWCIADDLPTLQADPALLQQLLEQLLANALKFTGKVSAPGAVIQVQPDPAASTATMAAWTVQDNGVGFDPARAGALFGVFQRLHREQDFEGLGAGLALCRTIAQRHGAHISATAQPGQGCTIQLLWPRGGSQ